MLQYHQLMIYSQNTTSFWNKPIVTNSPRITTANLMITSTLLFLAKAFEHWLSLKRNQAWKMANIRLKQGKMNNFIELALPPFTQPRWGLFVHARRLFQETKMPLQLLDIQKIFLAGFVRHSKCQPASGSADPGRADQLRLLSPLRPTEWAPSRERLSATSERLTPPIGKPCKGD
jgi:hypothetical protein